MSDARIIVGDCVAVLPALQRPRLIFADPPYNIGIDYGNGAEADRLPAEVYRDHLYRWVRACADALDDRGSLWFLLPHEWQAEGFLAMRGAGLHWRNSVTWHETFGVATSRKFGRCARLLHYFVRDPERFTFNADAVREESARQQYGDRRADPRGRIPGDVWKVSRICGTFGERVREVPTQLPVALIQPIVRACTDPGDLVIDPFAGSGTTGVVCREEGRRFIGVEVNPDVAEIATRRIENSRGTAVA